MSQKVKASPSLKCPSNLPEVKLKPFKPLKKIPNILNKCAYCWRSLEGLDNTIWVDEWYKGSLKSGSEVHENCIKEFVKKQYDYIEDEI